MRAPRHGPSSLGRPAQRPRPGARALPWVLLTLAGCGGNGTTDPPDPTTGSLRVVVHTTGRGLDEDGYILRIGESLVRSMLTEVPVVVSDLAPGEYELVLSGVSDNCTATPPTVLVPVVVGETAVVSLGVECAIDLRGRLVVSSEAYPQPQLVALYPDGTQRYRLFADAHANGSPAVFPDGSRVAFVSHRTGVARLYLFEAATGAITPLPQVGDMEFGPAVSPDGGRIAFEVMVTDLAGGEAFRIWVMGSDGSAPTAVTTGGPAEPSDFGPSWSADGEWIIFSRNGTLTQVRPDGSMLTSLSCTPAPCNHPDWTRAGDKLAYTALSDDNGDGVGENYDIYVLNTTTAMRTRLTTSPDQEDNPKWSPDGTLLAYQRVIGQRIQVFRMAADGSDPVNLTNRPISEGPVSWGP